MNVLFIYLLFMFLIDLTGIVLKSNLCQTQTGKTKDQPAHSKQSDQLWLFIVYFHRISRLFVFRAKTDQTV